jgi:hypothetical protein
MFRTKLGNRPKTKIERAKPYILLILLFLLACGTTAVMIRMDILSFLSDDTIITDYGQDPPIPGTGPPVTIRTPVEIIPLPDDLQSITEIRSVEISTIIEFRNETGEANLTYKIFFHEEEMGIFSTPPVVNRTLNLTADSDITHETVIDGDDRILSLFNGDEIAIAAEVVVVPGGGSENISGEAELIDFTVVILAAGERE